jgi:hypothetical protein
MAVLARASSNLAVSPSRLEGVILKSHKCYKNIQKKFSKEYNLNKKHERKDIQQIMWILI